MVGYLRPFSSFVAGLGRVRPGPFWLWTTLGTLIINALCWTVAETFLDVWFACPRLRWLLSGFVLLSAGGLLIAGSFYRALGRRKRPPAAKNPAIGA